MTKVSAAEAAHAAFKTAELVAKRLSVTVVTAMVEVKKALALLREEDRSALSPEELASAIVADTEALSGRGEARPPSPTVAPARLFPLPEEASPKKRSPSTPRKGGEKTRALALEIAKVKALYKNPEAEGSLIGLARVLNTMGYRTVNGKIFTGESLSYYLTLLEEEGK